MEPYVPAILLRLFSFTISVNPHNNHVRTIIILKKLYNFPKGSQYTPL